MRKHVRMLLTLVLVALCAGCASIPVPVGAIRINATHYAKLAEDIELTPKVLAAKVGNTQKGMSVLETYWVLGIDPTTPNFHFLDHHELRAVVYGTDISLENTTEAEEFASALHHMKAVQVPFTSITREGKVIPPLYAQYTNRGYNLLLTAVFRDEKLEGVMVTGERRIKTEEVYLLDWWLVVLTKVGIKGGLSMVCMPCVWKIEKIWNLEIFPEQSEQKGGSVNETR